MSDDSLPKILTQMTREPGGWRVPLTRNWMQGRTAFGGWTSAVLLEAAQRDGADLPPLRSALVNFTGPVTGVPLLTTRVLRQGRNVTTVAAEAQIADQVCGTATFSFGAAQDSAIAVAEPGPAAPEPESCPPLIPKQAQAMAPGFHHNFDIRLIEGDLPFSGSDRGYLRGWARHTDPQAWDGMVPLLCLADILPPAVFPLFPRPGPNSSMTWICNVLHDTPRTEAGWWQVETVVSGAANGYSSQHMRMWNSDGALVVDGMQSVVVFV